MFNQLFDCTVIGNGDALKPHWSRRTSFSSQESEVAACRSASSAPPSPRRCLRPAPFVRRHIIIKQALRTHIDGVVSLPPSTAPYAAKCLTLVITGSDLPGFYPASLPPWFYPLLGEIRIFAKTFGGTSPARIARTSTIGAQVIFRPSSAAS